MEATVNELAGITVYRVELTGGEAVHLRDLIVRDVGGVSWKCDVLRKLDRIITDFVKR